MGINLELRGSPQGDHITDLSTNMGGSVLCDWIESLPDGMYLGLKTLANQGTFTGSDRLATNLNDALKIHPPADPDTRHVATRFADLIGNGHADETVTLSS